MEQFINWWQHLPSQMNPVFFRIGNFAVHYYGMMYLATAFVAYLVAFYRLRRDPIDFGISKLQLQEVCTGSMLGAILGGRLGYVVFYNFLYYMRNPLQIILPFDMANGWKFIGISGMSFHGGLIGVLLFWVIYFRKRKLNLRLGIDLLGSGVALGYTFGRLGNFINGELYGRVTEGAIGMYFPAAGSELRHPSQLYEGFFEGIVLFSIMWFFRNRTKVKGTLLPIYLAGYGVFRFFIEYFREPDSHLGFVFLDFTMGQILCFGMVLTAILLYYLMYRLHKQELLEKESRKFRGRKKSKKR